MAKNPVSKADSSTHRLDAILEGRVGRAHYCLDQLVHTQDPVQRENFIALAKMELALLELALRKL